MPTKSITLKNSGISNANLVKSSAPKFQVSIWTKDFEYKLNSALGDPTSDVVAITVGRDLLSTTGNWSIDFVPKNDNDGRTWLDKLDVWDYVEIKFQGGSDTELEIMMRGLVDQVELQQSWEGGIPRRTIKASGRDLAALLTDHTVYYIPELKAKEAILKGKTLLAQKGNLFNATAQECFDFMGSVWKDTIDLTVAGGRIKISNKLDFKADSFFDEARSNNFLIETFEGPFWNLFQHYLDKPFHELFVVEKKDKSFLTMRPSRLKDAKGNLPDEVRQAMSSAGVNFTGGSGTSYERDFDLFDIELASLTVRKSINEMHNYYLVIPTQQLLAKESFRGSGLKGFEEHPEQALNPYFNLDSSKPSYIGKFGFRPLEIPTVFIPLDIGQLNSRGKDASQSFRDVVIGRSVKMNKTAVAWFLHSPYLLEGEAVIQGTNRAKIGTYMRLSDSPDKLEFYVEGVNHSFVNFQSYTTMLRLVRGQPSKEMGGLVSRRGDNVNAFYFGAGGGVNTLFPDIQRKKEDEEITKKEAEPVPVTKKSEFVLLPSTGTGYYFKGGLEQYAKPEVVENIKKIGESWAKLNYGTDLRVTALSLATPGPSPGHLEHQNGNDVDIAPVRNDSAKTGVTYTNTKFYSRIRTEALINLLRQYGATKIIFDDPNISNTIKDPSYAHPNHLHVHFG